MKVKLNTDQLEAISNQIRYAPQSEDYPEGLPTLSDQTVSEMINLDCAIEIIGCIFWGADHGCSVSLLADGVQYEGWVPTESPHYVALKEKLMDELYPE